MLPSVPGFSVRRVLGRGGMGTVFEALELSTGRTVALKLILAGWGAEREYRTRFEREVRTLASIDHPNVVPVYSASMWQGQPYFTMKYVEGQTLAHRLSEFRADPRAAARLLAAVARAVAHLHDRGIVHRDLKPINILLTPECVPLVADFGLVRPLTDPRQLSMSLVPLGTRQYMSPEQTRGERTSYTPACDIWALGVILYELLTGTRPFDHDDPVELVRLIREERVLVPPGARAECPELWDVALCCLEKDAKDRYQSAEDVAEALEAYAENRPAPAQPRRPLRLGRWLRRARPLVAACAAVLLLSATAIPAPVPPAERNKDFSPLERLQRGEDLVLIDADGVPQVPVSGLVPARYGRASMASQGVTYLELWRQQFPFVVELSGEVRARGTMNYSSAGFLVGAMPFPGQRPSEIIGWAFGVGAFRGPVVRGNTAEYSEKGLIHLLHYCTEQGGHPSFNQRDNHLDPYVYSVPKGVGTPPPDWHRITVTIDPTRLTGTFRGERFATIDSVRHFADYCGPRGVNPAVVLTPFGSSLGVYVSQAEAAYRNVRLRKLP